MTESQARQLEVDARLPLDQSWHPDSCDRLTISGVKWAVRPLKSPGTVAPTFDGGTVGVGLSLPDEDDPIASMAQAVIDAADIQVGELCPTCGRPLDSDLRVEMDGRSAFLIAAFEYVAALLRQQYAIDDGQLSSLLAFPANELPLWLSQIVTHAHGLKVDGKAA